MCLPDLFAESVGSIRSSFSRHARSNEKMYPKSQMLAPHHTHMGVRDLLSIPILSAVRAQSGAVDYRVGNAWRILEVH